MSKKLPHVSDHAVLRFLERVQGIHVETVRRHIENLCAAAVAAGATSLRADGHAFEFRNGAVVTITPNGPVRMSKTKIAQLGRRGESI